MFIRCPGNEGTKTPPWEAWGQWGTGRAPPVGWARTRCQERNERRGSSDYALKLGARGETYDTVPQNRTKEPFVAGLATGAITI